jgi:biotin transport system substrate-specific component
MSTLVQSFRTNSALQITLGILILFFCTQVTIPLHPVPITLQTVGVLLIALTYERAKAISTITLYITLGLLGFPMFLNFSSGLQIVTGYTWGYIMGWWFAIAIVSSLRAKIHQPSYLQLLALGLLANIIIFIFGITWLSSFIGLEKAIVTGLFPFILPGIGKTLLLVSLIRAVNTRVQG